MAHQPEGYDPYTFKNIAGSAVEPLMSMASGIPALAAGGLTGIKTIAQNAITGEDKEKW